MNPMWTPSVARIEAARITEFARVLERDHGIRFEGYSALWRWSVDNKAAFWSALWRYARVIGDPGERVLIDAEQMPGAQFFPDAKLNFAQNLLSRRAPGDPGDALVFWGEDQVRRRISHAELTAMVSRVA